VIFLTSDDSRETETEGLQLGAMDFIRKPFIPNVLTLRVRHAIELTRLQNNQVALTTELSQVGSTSYIESRARTDYSFLKPGELRFEIVNPECLEGYTEAELRILMQEMVY
jgi:DNA-binding response OmpR family regulator